MLAPSEKPGKCRWQTRFASARANSFGGARLRIFLESFATPWVGPNLRVTAPRRRRAVGYGPPHRLIPPPTWLGSALARHTGSRGGKPWTLGHVFGNSGASPRQSKARWHRFALCSKISPPTRNYV